MDLGGIRQPDTPMAYKDHLQRPSAPSPEQLWLPRVHIAVSFREGHPGEIAI